MSINMGSDIHTDEEAVNAYVSNLKNEELSEALKTYSFNPGPITRTTRSLYEKRLKKILSAQIQKEETATSATNEGDNNCQRQITEIHNNIQQQADNSNTDRGPEQVENSLKIEAGDSCEGKENIKNQSKDDNTTNKNDPSSNEKQYFSVQVPSVHNQQGPFIFESKEEALKFCKRFPGSRFKICTDLKSANDFGLSNSFGGSAFTKIRNGKATDQISSIESTTITLSRESLPFSSVKVSELCAFRVALEKGNVETVKRLVWLNPRYLIGSGDNPTVLQEGFRYNALHVCCKSNQLETCRVVIETINNPDFYFLLYKDEMPENRMMRLDFVVDLYLNNREKGNYETPLHFASKFGHEKLVNFLLSQPQIKKDLKNESGLTAMEVACSRVNKPAKELKQRILSAFEDQYYVFVLRSEDNSEPPQISRSFCPSLDKSLRGPIVPYLSQSPRSYKSLFDSPSNQITSIDLINIKAQLQQPSVSVLPSSNLSLAFSCKNPDAFIDEYVKNCKNTSSSSSSQSGSSFIKSSLNNQFDLPICCMKSSTCSESALQNGCSSSKVLSRSINSKAESVGRCSSATTSGSECSNIPIKRLFASATSLNKESKSEVSCKGVERSIINSPMSSVVGKTCLEGSVDDSNGKITDLSDKTCPERSVDSLNQILDTKSTDFKVPSSVPYESSSTSTVLTPLKSWSNGEPATPVSGSRKKVPVVCKTPKNKQLILLTTSGLEQRQPSCVKNDDQSNFRLNSSKKSDQDLGPDSSTKNNTPRSHWEKLIDLPIFSATDSPKRIRAIAGPMPKQKSEYFRRRVLLAQATPEEKNRFSRIRRTDSNKGLERVCRNIATEMNVSWSEYWEFLDCEVDLTSKDGLELFECHLKDSMDFSISVCEQSPINEVPEITADELNKDKEKKEFETFLCSAFSKLSVKSPTSLISSTVVESYRSQEKGDFIKDETSVAGSKDHSNDGKIESEGDRSDENVTKKSGSDEKVESEENCSNGKVESRNENDKNSSNEDQRSVCIDRKRGESEDDENEAGTTEESEEDEEEEKDAFHTPEESDKFSNPQSKLEDVEEFFELNSRRNLGMFIHGDLPTRTDADVFRALESMEDFLRAYPLIFNWFTLVKSYTESERSRWSEVTSLNHCLSTPCPVDRNYFSGDCESTYESPNVVRNLKHFFDV